MNLTIQQKDPTGDDVKRFVNAAEKNEMHIVREMLNDYRNIIDRTYGYVSSQNIT